MQDVYVIDCIRTPIGKYAGGMASVRPDDLAAIVLKELAKRNSDIQLSDIEDVIFGAANQAGEDNRNVARMALLLADYPDNIGGVTVNRLCASGLQSIMDASRAIRSGDGQLYVAGGTESMSRAPLVMGKSESAFDRKQEIHDTTIGWRFINAKLSDKHYPYTMGETAENVAERYQITREEQDEFAFHSQSKYTIAAKQHAFASEIVPVRIPQRKGEDKIVDTDEHPRLSPVEILSKLRPAFKKDGTVTAGNASGVNDGAAAMFVASSEYVNQHNLKPMAKVLSHAIAGVDPAVMGIGPVPAVKKALDRAGLTVDDIDLWELNEAFAAQSIACIRDLEIDSKKVNIKGGAIALGHPLGCSGTRIATTLIHSMKESDAKYGVATMCIGVGQGAAIVFERV